MNTNRRISRLAVILPGIVHSLTGLVLVRVGGFALFEKVMSVCIGGMFVCVLLTTVLAAPGVLAITLLLFAYMGVLQLSKTMASIGG